MCQAYVGYDVVLCDFRGWWVVTLIWELNKDVRSYFCASVCIQAMLSSMQNIARNFKLTYLLTHGAEPFWRSRQFCSYSRISQHFMEPEEILNNMKIFKTKYYGQVWISDNVLTVQITQSNKSFIIIL
jgi:hypothetical protein